MATQQDLQNLLRLLTGTRKLPMLQAMQQVKALQAVNLRRRVNPSHPLTRSQSPEAVRC